MSSRAWHERLDRVTNVVADVERRSDLEAVSQRIHEMTATREDFEFFVRNQPNDLLDELVNKVLADPDLLSGTEHISGPLLGVIVNILATPPGQAVNPKLLAELEECAEPQPITFWSWLRGPTENLWYVANIALCVLGDDLAEGARVLTAPAIAADRRKKAARRQEVHEMIREHIRAGGHKWQYWMIYYDRQSEVDQPLVRARAIERIEERRNGTVSPATTPFELAAEIASYRYSIRLALPEDARASAAAEELGRRCKAAAPEGHPGYDDWADANRWYWALGAGKGTKLRELMAAEGIYDDPP